MQYISIIGFGVGHYPNAFDVFIQMCILVLLVANVALFVVQLNRERYGMPKATKMALTGIAALVLTLVLHSALIPLPVLGVLGIAGLYRIHVWQYKQMVLTDSNLVYPYQVLAWVNLGVVVAIPLTVVASALGLA